MEDIVAEKTIFKDVVVYTNIHFNGTLSLIAKKTVSTYRITHLKKTSTYSNLTRKELIDEKSETVVLPLAPTNREELLEYRRAGKPSIILKDQGNLYYGAIPYEMVFSEIDGHLCAKYHHECMRLNASSDEDGGCAKVRHRSRGLEYFKWIPRGFETFGTIKDSFIVFECKHYIETPKKIK